MENSVDINRTDIVYHGWVGHMPQALRPYLILMRADRPIGTWLLLLPCLWSLTLASSSWPSLSSIALFALGAYVMRGAGCVMNDLADRNFDGRVARTATRPIPNGDVTPLQAAAFMGFLCLVGLGVLLQFNSFTVMLACASLGLVFIYPFCKRWTYWPQVVLGLTFNWGALVGWASVNGSLDWPAVCLYVAGLFWTLGYDTVYAHQDKDDDILIGIKSAALRLGEKTVPALWFFYSMLTGLVLLAGYLAETGVLFYAAMILPIGHLIWQIRIADIHDAPTCLKIFKANKWFGWLLLFAFLMGKVPV